jgi:hypothetical protein
MIGQSSDQVIIEDQTRQAPYCCSRQVGSLIGSSWNGIVSKFFFLYIQSFFVDFYA